MKYRFSICRTVSSLFVLFFLIFAIFCGGDGLAFIHIPALIAVCGLAFFMTLAVYELEFLKFIVHSCGLFTCRPTEPNPRFAQIALFASRSVIGAGVITMIIGLVQMLQNLSDPSSIGAGMAVSLLSPFYAILISEIPLAIVFQSFKDAQAEPEKEGKDKVLPVVNAGLPLLIILFTLFTYMFLILSFCRFEPYQMNGAPFY